MSTLNPQEILESLGAIIIDSHLVYTSWRHGSAYVNKDALYPHTRETSLLCKSIAEHFIRPFGTVETVIAPAVGGVILSQWIAYHLSVMDNREVAGVYADKTVQLGSALWYMTFGLRLLDPTTPQLGRAPEDSFEIKRGYDAFITGKRVLVVEDVLNSGKTARKVVEAVRRINGTVVGVAALCNRGGVTSKDVGDVPELHSLLNIKMDSWDEADCPLCKRGVPINTAVGKGKEFLEKRQKN